MLFLNTHREPRGPILQMDAEAFAKHAILVHGEAYRYGLVQYRGMDTPILIGCPRHGGFYQTPSEHLIGAGCPECAK